MIITQHWMRRCQECGHLQKGKQPAGEATYAYRNAKCKRCKSSALDYGTFMNYDEHGNRVFSVFMEYDEE